MNKYVRRLPLLLFFFLPGILSHAQTSDQQKVKDQLESKIQESDLIISVHSEMSLKELKSAIKLIKKSVDETVKIEYKIGPKGKILEFSYEDEGQGCASDKFGRFSVVIQQGDATGCSIRDRKE